MCQVIISVLITFNCHPATDDKLPFLTISDCVGYHVKIRAAEFIGPSVKLRLETMEKMIMNCDPLRIFLAIVSIKFICMQCIVIVAVSVFTCVVFPSQTSSGVFLMAALHHQQYHFHPYLPLLRHSSPDYQCFRWSGDSIIIQTSLNQYCNNCDTMHASSSLK